MTDCSSGAVAAALRYTAPWRLSAAVAQVHAVEIKKKRCVLNNWPGKCFQVFLLLFCFGFVYVLESRESL